MSDIRSLQPRIRYEFTSKTDRIKVLLYDTPDEIKSKFKWDDEAMWSMTHKHIGETLCEELLKLPAISSESMITDAMASVGGNTIPFSRYFASVTAVEINIGRKKMLDYNLQLHGIKNVTTIHEDYSDVMYSIRQDIVFFDPPWGLGYRKNQNMRIKINDKHIEDLISRCRAKYVMVKLPRNYDFAFFESRVSPHLIVGEISYERPYSSVFITVQL